MHLLKVISLTIALACATRQAPLAKSVGDDVDQLEPTSEQTNRELRNAIRFQVTPSILFIILGVQLGIDLDYFLTEDISVGYTRQEYVSITSPQYEHSSLHLKRFIGDSLYVKASVGVHSKPIGDDDVDDAQEVKGVGALLELGSDYMLWRHVGMGISYFSIGVMYNDQTQEADHVMFYPALRVFGAF